MCDVPAEGSKAAAQPSRLREGIGASPPAGVKQRRGNGMSVTYTGAMRALDRLETFLQDLMERPAWLLMPRRINPLRIANALTRELEGRGMRLIDRIVVPDRYEIFLSTEDLRELDGVRPTIEAELIDYVSRLAVERDLTLLATPAVNIEQRLGMRQGDLQIVSSFSGGAAYVQPQQSEASTVLAPNLPPAQRPFAPPPRLHPVPSRGAALVLLGRDGQELRRFSIDRPQLTIGRRSSNDIPIPDIKMSRQHARIEVANGPRYYLTDLGSTNGTRINGREARGRNELQPGDIIELGLQRMRFEA